MQRGTLRYLTTPCYLWLVHTLNLYDMNWKHFIFDYNSPYSCYICPSINLCLHQGKHTLHLLFITLPFPSTECYSLRHRDRRKDSVDARSISSRGSDGKTIQNALSPVWPLEGDYERERQGNDRRIGQDNSSENKVKAGAQRKNRESRRALELKRRCRGLMMTLSTSLLDSLRHSCCYFKESQPSAAPFFLQSNHFFLLSHFITLHSCFLHIIPFFFWSFLCILSFCALSSEAVWWVRALWLHLFCSYSINDIK